jgi:hypothetical protein
VPGRVAGRWQQADTGAHSSGAGHYLQDTGVLKRANLGEFIAGPSTFVGETGSSRLVALNQVARSRERRHQALTPELEVAGNVVRVQVSQYYRAHLLRQYAEAGQRLGYAPCGTVVPAARRVEDEFGISDRRTAVDQQLLLAVPDQ